MCIRDRPVGKQLPPVRRALLEPWCVRRETGLEHGALGGVGVVKRAVGSQMGVRQDLGSVVRARRGVRDYKSLANAFGVRVNLPRRRRVVRLLQLRTGAAEAQGVRDAGQKREGGAGDGRGEDVGRRRFRRSR